MQIDWLTVAAQIVNFLVLVWLLQRFLYRPIVSAMAERENRIETRLAEAKDARTQVAAEAERLRAAQAELAASREQVLREVQQEADDLRKTLTADLHAEMEARRHSWETHLADERQAFAARLRQRAGHQVIDIVARVLKDYAGSDLAGQLASTFADRLATLDTAARDKLGDAANRAADHAADDTDQRARVESSVPLTPAARRQITRAIHDHIAPDLDVAYLEDDSLLLGLRLTIGEQTLEWSATRFLGRLETTLDEVIEGRPKPRSSHRAATG